MAVPCMTQLILGQQFWSEHAASFLHVAGAVLGLRSKHVADGVNQVTPAVVFSQSRLLCLTQSQRGVDVNTVHTV